MMTPVPEAAAAAVAAAAGMAMKLCTRSIHEPVASAPDRANVDSGVVGKK